MSSQSQRYAARVLQGLRDAGLYTDAAVGDVNGPSTSTLTKYRAAAADPSHELARPRGDVLDAVDRACRWERGSARNLWENGAEPTPAVTSGLVSPELEAEVRRIAREEWAALQAQAGRATAQDG